jgi:hypothetical protein
MTPQEISALVQPYVGKKCFLDLAADNPHFPRRTSMPVEVIDWSDEEAMETLVDDISDIFESYDDFSPKRTVPFGLVSLQAHSGGTDWDGILTIDAKSGKIELFLIKSYRFVPFADKLDGLLRVDGDLPRRGGDED